MLASNCKSGQVSASAVIKCNQGNSFKIFHLELFCLNNTLASIGWAQNRYIQGPQTLSV